MKVQKKEIDQIDKLKADASAESNGGSCHAVPTETISGASNVQSGPKHLEDIAPSNDISRAWCNEEEIIGSGPGIYDGDWVDGVRNGEAVFVSPSCATYKGSFKNDYAEGHGIMKYVICA